MTAGHSNVSLCLMENIVLQSIGTVHSTRKKPADDNWDIEKAYIELDDSQFSPEALVGVCDFSHVEIIFHMDRVDPNTIERAGRHPRNNTNWPKVGIFAQRGRNRPNLIGTTICKVLKVEGTQLHVEGLDALDGTPVLDIKPWVTEFAPRGSVFQPKWISELMQKYWRF
jgi:tRNA (adenine37-N6)-methyltransferase